MNERAADIASDVNRAAAGIGGAIANAFMPGSGPLIGMAGNAISGIVDRESGRADRERAAKRKADAEDRAAQAKAEREEFKRRQDLLDEAARREAKRRAMTRPRDRVSWTDRADRIRAQGLDPSKLSNGDIDRVIRYFGQQTGMSPAQLDAFISGRMNAGPGRPARGTDQEAGISFFPTDRESLQRYRAALARPEGRDPATLEAYRAILDQEVTDPRDLPRPPAGLLEEEDRLASLGRRFVPRAPSFDRSTDELGYEERLNALGERFAPNDPFFPDEAIGGYEDRVAALGRDFSPVQDGYGGFEFGGGDGGFGSGGSDGGFGSGGSDGGFEPGGGDGFSEI